MIFPIQPPLTERDDKAATVIIAVVYGARWPPKCAGSVIYRSPLFSSFPPPFSLHCRSRFYFPLVSTLSQIQCQRKHFCRSSNRSGGDVSVTRNDLLTIAGIIVTVRRSTVDGVLCSRIRAWFTTLKWLRRSCIARRSRIVYDRN